MGEYLRKPSFVVLLVLAMVAVMLPVSVTQAIEPTGKEAGNAIAVGAPVFTSNQEALVLSEAKYPKVRKALIELLGKAGFDTMLKDHPVLTQKLQQTIKAIGIENFKKIVEIAKGAFTEKEIAEFIVAHPGRTIYNLNVIANKIGVEKFGEAFNALKEVVGADGIRAMMGETPGKSLRLFGAVARMGTEKFKEIMNFYGQLVSPQAVKDALVYAHRDSAKILNIMSDVGVDKFQSIVIGLLKTNKDWTVSQITANGVNFAEMIRDLAPRVR